MNEPLKIPSRPLKWQDIIHELASLFLDSETYFVGGIVRDVILGRESHDIDLVTRHNGLHVAKKIANQLGGDYYALDAERQVGRAIVFLEATRYVIDVASVRGGSIEVDLQLRDFTINAMLVDPAYLNQIIDPLDGYNDLVTRHRLKECSSASIADDPIRALRAIRLARQFGLHMEKTLQTSVRKYGPLLRAADGRLVQPERVRDEMVKIFGMTNTSRILRVMDTMGLLTACLPAYWENAVQFERQLLIADALGALESVISRSRDDNTASKLLLGVMVVALDQFRNELGEFLSHQFSDRNTAVLMMMLLLTPPQLTPEAWVSFFRLSRAEGKFLTALSRAWKYSVPLSGELNDRHLHKYFREFGEAGIGGILLHLAEQLARQTLETQPELWGDFLEYRTVPFLDAYFRKYQSVIAPHPLITGDDLQKAMGVKQGRIMGEILEAILEAQAAGELKTKKQALQYARQMLRKSPVEMGGN